MKKTIQLGIFLSVMSSSVAFAANDGKITRLDFSGSNSTWGGAHNDIIQLQIEGGFSAPNCSSTYAGIRKSDEHLTGAVMMAMAADKRVVVYLSDADTYISGRCIITDLFVYK